MIEYTIVQHNTMLCNMVEYNTRGNVLRCSPGESQGPNISGSRILRIPICSDPQITLFLLCQLGVASVPGLCVLLLTIIVGF